MLARAGIDGAVLRLAENILLLTGYFLQNGGLPALVVPAVGDPCLIAPEFELEQIAVVYDGEVRAIPSGRLDEAPATDEVARQLADLGRERGLAGGRIGFEGSFEAVSPPIFAGEPNAVGLPTIEMIRERLGPAELVDVTSELERLRAVKNGYELERLRAANEVAMIGLDAFKEDARPGITEAALAARVEEAIRREGHERCGARVVRAWATVWSGPKTELAWYYFDSAPRRIERDDIVMIELGTVADGYWADHTRTVAAGRASDRQRAAFEAARGATRAALAAARPGESGERIDAAARTFCAEAGFEQFPHHTGHGTGFRYHEALPWLAPGEREALAGGMAIAVEPGIYMSGLGGFRWEDDAVVGPDGATELASSDFGLE